MNHKSTYRYNIFQNLSYILSGALKWQPLIPFFMFMQSMTTGIIPFVWLYGAKQIINVIENTDASSYNVIINIVLITALVEILCFLGKEIGFRQIEARMTDVRCKFILMLNQKLMTMPYEMTEDPKIMDAWRKTWAATNNPVEGIEGVVKFSAVVLSQFIIMIVAAVILLRLSPVLVVIMSVLALLTGIITDRVAKWEKDNVDDMLSRNAGEERYYYWKSTNSEYAKDIRVFKMQNAIEQKYRSIMGEKNRKLKILRGKQRSASLKCSGIELVQEGAMYAWLVVAVVRNGMSIADFTLYLGSIRSFNQAVRSFLFMVVHLIRSSRFTCDYRAFAAYPEKEGEEPKVSSFKKDYRMIMEKETEESASIPVPVSGKYEFVFDNVSFRYPGREEYTLKNINIKLEAGKRLAVVGLNGAGKTTFIKLLCRLYEPTDGKIYMNGEDISKYDRDEYYKLIAPIFQTVECFAFPISENVSMLPPDKTDKERAKNALDDAGLGEKIKSMENGIDTKMLKFLYLDGVDLSGGEKQKLGLARSLYKNSPIIVLDEPTAALDAIAEYKTYMDFDRLIGGKTAVYISHRLSSTRFCHSIAMFKNGEIIERGTHDELLKQGGEYANMFEVQAQYYISST